MGKFNTIIKLLIWGSVIYGFYYIIQLYPLESIIAIGIITIGVIGYWLFDLNKN